jgi:ferrous iron transport protein A
MRQSQFFGMGFGRLGRHRGMFRHGHGWGRGRGKRRGFLAAHGASGCFSLNFAALGVICRVVRMKGDRAVRQRLLDLGLQPGCEVIVLRNAPLNDPIELKVGDSYIAIRRQEAEGVEVEYV